jgi:hypothetical protein
VVSIHSSFFFVREFLLLCSISVTVTLMITSSILFLTSLQFCRSGAEAELDEELLYNDTEESERSV